MSFLGLEGKKFLVVGVANKKSVAYHIDRYGPEVFQKYTDLGANFIVDNGFLPIWTWNTHQTNAANGPHDRSILLWYQVNGLSAHGLEDPAASHWDTDRMNLFTWKRIEDHAAWLADRGVYTWGFQGLIKGLGLTVAGLGNTLLRPIAFGSYCSAWRRISSSSASNSAKRFPGALSMSVNAVNLFVLLAFIMSKQVFSNRMRRSAFQNQVYNRSLFIVC